MCVPHAVLRWLSCRWVFREFDRGRRSPQPRPAGGNGASVDAFSLEDGGGGDGNEKAAAQAVGAVDAGWQQQRAHNRRRDPLIPSTSSKSMRSYMVRQLRACSDLRFSAAEAREAFDVLLAAFTAAARRVSDFEARTARHIAAVAAAKGVAVDDSLLGMSVRKIPHDREQARRPRRLIRRRRAI